LTDAIQTYLNTVKNLCPEADDNALEFLVSEMTTTVLNKKQFYIKADTIQTNVGFVFKGLLRAYYIDSKGNEITVRFTKENEFATDYVGFIGQTQSKYYFQCLEPTQILNLPYLHMKEAYTKFSSLEKYGRLIAEEVLKSQQKRIHSFLFENAEQRYINFVKENPDLYNRVSLSYLSTFLGIERPSLSRIRKKIAQH
jgi:CRP/FNR family transcriptional regulator